MKFLQGTQYIGSYMEPEQLPLLNTQEIAFLGRSNVGKSSAINALLQRKALTRVSKIPGCTRTINLYEIPQLALHLVDLPGYGYSQTSKKMKSLWKKSLMRYLIERPTLIGVCVLLDIRRGVTEKDHDLLEIIASLDISLHVLVTKSDKASAQEMRTQLRIIQNALEAYQISLSIQTFSSFKRTGIPEAWKVFQEWLSLENNILEGQ